MAFNKVYYCLLEKKAPELKLSEFFELEHSCMLIKQILNIQFLNIFDLLIAIMCKNYLFIQKIYLENLLKHREIFIKNEVVSIYNGADELFLSIVLKFLNQRRV
jgi:hypothetical protein